MSPSCRHFGRCGGCDWLDRDIGAQLDAKRAAVRDALAPLAGDVDVAVDPPPRAPLFARTKVLYPVQPDSRRGLTIGLYERGTHRVVEIRECKTQLRALTEIGRRVQSVLRGMRLEPYDETRATGFVRAVQARVMPGTDELMVGVVTRGGEFADAPELADRIIEACADLRGARGRRLSLVGVVRNIQDATGNVLLGPRTVPLRGREYQVDRAGRLRFQVGFTSFYQVHRLADRLLYRPALEMLGDVADQHVVDGYGGVGTFAVRLAAAGARRVDLIESSRSACRDARRNAELNDLPSIAVHERPFAAGDLPASPAAMVVDPPRAGLLDDGVASVVASRPERLLLVSCSLRALARDVAGLLAGGYRVDAARLVDLFPYTEHVEVLVLLRRTA